MQLKKGVLFRVIDPSGYFWSRVALRVLNLVRKVGGILPGPPNVFLTLPDEFRNSVVLVCPMLSQRPTLLKVKVIVGLGFVLLADVLRGAILIVPAWPCEEAWLMILKAEVIKVWSGHVLCSAWAILELWTGRDQLSEWWLCNKINVRHCTVWR